MKATKDLKAWEWGLLLFGRIILFTFLAGLATLFQSVTSNNWLNSAFLLAAGVLFLLIYHYWNERVERREATETAPDQMVADTAKGFLVGFIYFGVVTGTMALAGDYHITGIRFDTDQQLLYLCLYFTVALSEEIIFRGIFFRLLDERWGMWTSFAVSALFFGLMHLSNDNATIWSAICIALEAGLPLAAAYKYSGNLWLPIGIHWAWNYTQGNIFGFGVSGIQGQPSLFTPRIEGSEWLTGGAFGAEASVIAAIGGLILSAWFIHKIIKNEQPRRVDCTSE